MVSAFPVSAFEGSTGQAIKNINKQAIERYNQVKERYNVAAREWNGASDDFKEVREKIKRYDNLNSDDQERVMERTREFLDKTIERMELHLEIMKSWAERIDITEERRELILEDIEEKKSELEDYKSRIESSEDLDSLRDLAKEIRDAWKGFNPDAKRISGELLTAKVGDIIEDSEELSISLQEKLEDLDQSAEEVIQMQELLDDFNTNLDLAKEQYGLAQSAYEGIEDVADADQLFKETKEFVFAARDYLKEAHKSLRELVITYREYTGVVPEQDPEDDSDDNETDESVSGDKFPEVEDATEE